MKIGVLATQGNVNENIIALQKSLGNGDSVRYVRDARTVDEIDGLIIPGGESTAIGPLSEISGSLGAIRKRAQADELPILGICAGLVLISHSAKDKDSGFSTSQALDLVDVDVERNSFGHQSDSFESEIAMPEVGIEKMCGIFIRAPTISRAGPGVQVIAKLGERIVGVRQGPFIGVAFHPELDSYALHKKFTEIVSERV